MPDVFISYSRRDADFMKQIFDALTEQGRDVWVDWEDIPPTADWWREVREGIEESDNFVFILSPESIASPICNFEIAHAMECNKRIIPIVWHEVDEHKAFAQLLEAELNQSTEEILAGRDLMKVARQCWGEIARHNWIMFADGADFNEQFKILTLAINEDIAYVKAHTRYLQRALNWHSHERFDDFLLKGAEVEFAESWLQRSTGKTPEPTNLHYRFISESRIIENQRLAREQQLAHRVRNLIIAVFGILLIAAIGIVLIFAQNNADLQNEAATLQAMVDTAVFQQGFVQSQINWQNTRQPGLGGFPLSFNDLTQTPVGLFLATAGAQVIQSQREPQLQDFDGVPMVFVPKGCFWMGSYDGASAEKPVHEVCINTDYWIDLTEVTEAQYQACVADGVCERRAVFFTTIANEMPYSANWFNAVALCEWRNARLPTEAEWEYAARGPNSLLYPWGNEFLADNAHYRDNSEDVAAVGSLPQGASWVGALDMSGNVWEWTSSLYEPYPYLASDGREAEPTSGTDAHRVLRGGSIGNNPDSLQTFVRSAETPDLTSSALGFRCVRN